MKRIYLALLFLIVLLDSPIFLRQSVEESSTGIRASPVKDERLSFSFRNRTVFEVKFNSSFPSQYLKNVTRTINKYIPKIAELFWQPTINVSVMISSYNRTDAPRVAIASADPELDDKGMLIGLDGTVWVAAKKEKLEDKKVWIHEFTHILQFTACRARTLHLSSWR